MLPTLFVPGSLRNRNKLPGIDSISPIDYILSWIRMKMPEFGSLKGTEDNRILIVKAETGSGKSTALPVEIFRMLRAKNTPPTKRFKGPTVICTQPRVLTSIQLAKDVSVENSPYNPDIVLGETVGYQTGPVKLMTGRGLVYATHGTLEMQLKMLADSEIMDKYKFIIVDEAHERSTELDMMLVMLKNFYQRNSGNNRLPFLLLTSATIDPETYTAFFNISEANIIEVAGHTYHIETHWPDANTNSYAAEAAAVAIRIHEGHPDDPPEKADILIFMPGQMEITTVTGLLHKANKKYIENGDEPEQIGPMIVLELNSDVINTLTGDYALAFLPAAKLPRPGGRRPVRRVIVSTVVAETGITFATLKYVIDSGWHRAPETYYPENISGLISRPIDQTRTIQRRGRVGRLFDGEFYPLYTKNVFEALDSKQLPNIISQGGYDIFLSIVREQQHQKLRMGVLPEFRVEDIIMLDPPPIEALMTAISSATVLGFLSPFSRLPDRWPPPMGSGAPHAGVQGYGLTPLGFAAAQFSYRRPMEVIRTLLAGLANKVAASDLVTVAAMYGKEANHLYVYNPQPPADYQRAHRGAAGLYASLPFFLATRLGGGMGAPPTGMEAAFYRARLLLSDEFAEDVLVFDAFVKRLEASKGDLASVAIWAADCSLDINNLISLAKERDEVMESMVMAGLPPTSFSDRRLSALPPETFTEGLIRFKQCLYEGMVTHLMQWEPKGSGESTFPGYYTKQGLRVKTPPLFSEAAIDRIRMLGEDFKIEPPKWILTDRISIGSVKRSKPSGPNGSHAGENPLMYELKAGKISYLDGYVDVDPFIDAPRLNVL